MRGLIARLALHARDRALAPVLSLPNGLHGPHLLVVVDVVDVVVAHLSAVEASLDHAVDLPSFLNRKDSESPACTGHHVLHFVVLTSRTRGLLIVTLSWLVCLHNFLSVARPHAHYLLQCTASRSSRSQRGGGFFGQRRQPPPLQARQDINHQQPTNPHQTPTATTTTTPSILPSVVTNTSTTFGIMVVEPEKLKKDEADEKSKPSNHEGAGPSPAPLLMMEVRFRLDRAVCRKPTLWRYASSR